MRNPIVNLTKIIAQIYYIKYFLVFFLNVCVASCKYIFVRSRNAVIDPSKEKKKGLIYIDLDFLMFGKKKKLN